MAQPKERPESWLFFDGITCPICKVRILRKERFKDDISCAGGLDAFVLEYCRSQILVGFVLEENLVGSFIDSPDWVLYNFTTFTCPICAEHPSKRWRIRSFGGALASGVFRADLRCQCGETTDLTVVVRRWGFDVLPNVLPEEDRPPAESEGSSEIQDYLFKVHATKEADLLTEIRYLGNGFGDRAVRSEPVRSRIQLEKELHRVGILEKIRGVAAREGRTDKPIPLPEGTKL